MTGRPPAELPDFVAQVLDYAIFTLDPDGHVESWNAGAQALKGYTHDEALGLHFSAFYTDDDRAAGLPQRLLDRARTDGRVDHTGWRVRKDGTRFWGDVVITALHDPTGTVTGYTKITRDRTDHHELELEVQHSEIRFRQLVADVVDYAIIALDPDGNVESWNAGAQALKGYTHDEALGLHFSAFYTDDDRAAGLPQRLLDRARTDGRVDHTGWRVRKDGTRFWGDVVITALHDPTGTVTGYTKITRDRTEQHRLEQARESLFAAVSHDLRSPVFAIGSYAQLLAGDDLDPDSRRRYAELVLDSAERVASMVNDLVEHAKLRAGSVPVRPEPMVLGDVVRAAVARAAHLLGGREVAVGGPDSLVLADRDAMARVLDNVIGNAARYSPPGSPIAIGLIAATGRGGPRVRITDRGRGIDPDDLPVIFDEFVRGRLAEEDGGTGLGLASVKRLMDAQGGTVRIESELGTGTTVELELPAGADATSGAALDGAGHGSGARAVAPHDGTSRNPAR